jgi:hypothetical protein
VSSKQQNQDSQLQESTGFLRTACRLLPAAFLLLAAHCLLLTEVRAQVVVDKTVATVNNGSLATPDVITYSDVIWQLALERDVSLDKPSSKDLTHALEKLEDQRLILLEAKKLPGSETIEARKTREDKVQVKRDELARELGSRAILEQRMAKVGLTSEQLNDILRDRVDIEDYIDFRFRAFVLIADKEIVAYYNEVYGRQRNRGIIVPTLAQAHDEIEHKLTEDRIGSQIDNFVDTLRERAEIVTLNPLSPQNP